MTTPQIILGIAAAFVLIGIVGWALVRNEDLGEDDPEPEGYVNQDTQTDYSRDAWKHAAVKTHHAE